MLFIDFIHRSTLLEYSVKMKCLAFLIKKKKHLLICRVLVRRARKLAQQYFLVYQEPIPTGQLVQRVASVMQEYTQSGWV